MGDGDHGDGLRLVLAEDDDDGEARQLVAAVGVAVVKQGLRAGRLLDDFREQFLPADRAPGIAGGSAASARQKRVDAIGRVGIELLFNRTCRQTKHLASCGGFEGFEIHAIGGAAAQQRIYFSGCGAGQLRGE